MRTRVLILIAAVVAALGIAVPTTLAATDDGIVVFEPASQVSDTFLDLGEGGFSAGDIILENARVVDPDTGESVGRVLTRIQVVEPLDGGDFLFILDCTVQLSGGNLTFYGAGAFGDVAEGIDFALTGGTGRYSGTRGTVTVAGAEVNGEEGVTITFRLTRR